MGVAISDLLDGVRPLSGDIIAALRGSETVKVQLPTLKRYLTENLQLYIAPSGSNVSGDGSQGNPWATMQYAYDWIVRNVNLNGYDANINMAAGTYTDAFVNIVDQEGAGFINFVGDVVTPSNVLVQTASTAFQQYAGKMGVSGMKIVSGGWGLYSAQRGEIYTRGPIEFGACTSGHTTAQYGALIRFNANYTISGGSPYHMMTETGGRIILTGITATLVGTPAFSSAFARSGGAGNIYRAGSQVWSGAATGVRYSAVMNGTIYVGGQGSDYFPGSSAGSVATGGQYA